MTLVLITMWVVFCLSYILSNVNSCFAFSPFSFLFFFWKVKIVLSFLQILSNVNVFFPLLFFFWVPYILFSSLNNIKLSPHMSILTVVKQKWAGPKHRLEIVQASKSNRSLYFNFNFFLFYIIGHFTVRIMCMLSTSNHINVSIKQINI